MTLTVLDTFAGIGGFSLGLEETGFFETVAFCEIEPYPQRILASRWPEVPIYDDITTLTAERLRGDGLIRGPGDIDVITGGFPCQDLSNAGSRAGIDGERSGLWAELARLIGEVRPRYAILENVTALLAGDRGRWFGRVLGDLAALGYDVEWHCIPAARVGASHRRDRVWIVAYSPHDGPPNRRRPAELTGTQEPATGSDGPGLPDADVPRLEGSLLRGLAAIEAALAFARRREEVAHADRRRLEELGEPEHAELEGARGDELDGRGPGGRRDGEEALPDAGRSVEGRGIQSERGPDPRDADASRYGPEGAPRGAGPVPDADLPRSQGEGSGELRPPQGARQSRQALADSGPERLHERGLDGPARGEGGLEGGVRGDELPGGEGETRPALPDAERVELRDEPGRERGEDGASPPQSRDDGEEGSLADAASLGPSGPGEPLEPVGEAPPADRETSLAWPERVADFWATEPDVGRVAHGVPARVDRLKCLGNAIVPPIACLIGQAIAEREGLDG